LTGYDKVMASKFETHKLVVVNTGHIPEVVALTDNVMVAGFHETDDGWFMALFDLDHIEEELSYSPAGSPEHMLHTVAKNIRLLAPADVTWVRFDCDGPIVEGLELYDW